MKSIAFILLLLLSSCGGGLSVAKFDSGQYSKLVQATSVLNPDLCSNTKDKIVPIMNDFRKQIDWVDLYEGGMTGNFDTHKNLSVVLDETDRFIEQLHKTDSLSAFYCKTKVEGMRHTMKIILSAEARKPQ